MDFRKKKNSNVLNLSEGTNAKVLKMSGCSNCQTKSIKSVCAFPKVLKLSQLRHISVLPHPAWKYYFCLWTCRTTNHVTTIHTQKVLIMSAVTWIHSALPCWPALCVKSIKNVWTDAKSISFVWRTVCKSISSVWEFPRKYYLCLSNYFSTSLQQRFSLYFSQQGYY